MAQWKITDLIGGNEDSVWGIRPVELIQVFKHMEYSLGESVADVIDNSIDIGAKEIDVYYDYDPNTKSRYLIIADNGKGMTESALQSSMDLGAKRRRATDQLGKFGIGLKLSSLAQADEITVLTKRDKKSPCVRRISYDYIKETRELKLLKTINSQSHYSDIQELSSNYSSGTVILWEEMNAHAYNFNRQTDRKKFKQEMINLGHHLSMTFQRFIDGSNSFGTKVVIRLNDQILQPLDPFLTYLQDFKPKDNGTKIDVEHITYNGDPIKITYCIIPHEERIPNNPDVGRLTEYFNGFPKAQGTYVYRNDRLISSGGWANSTQWASHSSRKLSRIGIDLKPKLDVPLGLTPTKTGYDFPGNFLDHIKDNCDKVRSDNWEIRGRKKSFSEKSTHRNRHEGSRIHVIDVPKQGKTPKKDTVEKKGKRKIDSGHQPKQPIIEESQPKPQKSVEAQISNAPILTELIWVNKRGNKTEIILNSGHSLFNKAIEALKRLIEKQ